MLKRIRKLVNVSLLLFSSTLFAQEKHSGHAHGTSQVTKHAQTELVEGGQSTFAALIEIVSLLQTNPDTEWEKVDIDALREHLLDMNRLMLSTSATAKTIATNTIQFEVQGTGAALGSIHRMVSTHSTFIQTLRNWDVQADLTSTGALVQIETDEIDSLRQLNALGFYGFMSLDSHHQDHHLGIATGKGH